MYFHFGKSLRQMIRPSTERHALLLGHVPPSTERGLTDGSVYSINAFLQRIMSQREIRYKTSPDRPEARVA